MGGWRWSGVLVLGAMGCGAPAMTPLDAYVGSLPPADAALLRAYGEGAERVLVKRSKARSQCAVTIASTRAEAERGDGTPVDRSDLPDGVHPFEVRETFVHSDGGDGALVLRVEIASGTRWLSLPAGRDGGCVQPVPKQLARAQMLVGKSVTFEPARPECREVHAAGRQPGAFLVDSESALPMRVDGLTLGSASALRFADGVSGPELWASLASGSLQVRADVLARCFSEGAPAARRTSLELLRVEPERCSSSQDDGQALIECRSSVAAWEGVVTDKAVAIRAVRRTLGALHLLGDRLVSGARYARTVVGVRLGSASDGRRQRVYGELSRAIGAALAQGAEGVRVTAPGAADQTYEIGVELGEVVISDLVTSEAKLVARYKVRDDVRPNPKKPAARQRVDAARRALTDAEQDHRVSSEDFNRRKAELKAECDAQAAKATGWGAVAATVGCSTADALIQPSDASVRNARAELGEAEAALASMPDSISVPIMGQWPYTRREYMRNVSATLKISTRPAHATAPRVVDLPLQYTWQDHEIEPDAAHGIPGHRPERAAIDDPDALVPHIAKAAATAIASHLRAALAEARMESVKRAMSAAGVDAQKPGYELVDALAFDVAGDRLERPLLRGLAQISRGQTAELPLVTIASNEQRCILAVAHADGAAAELGLSTRSGSHADLRRNDFAAVEICPEEGARADDALELAGSSGTGTRARWTIYATHRGRR